MVVACAAADLADRPARPTSPAWARRVSDGITQTLNVAFAKLPAPAESNCVPVGDSDPQVTPASFGYTGGSDVVDQNANELWTVLVCKPWLDGEFGTTATPPARAPSRPWSTHTAGSCCGRRPSRPTRSRRLPDPGQAEHLRGHRGLASSRTTRPSTRCSRASSGPDPAGDRVRGAVRRAGRRGAGAADRDHPDPAEARVPAAAGGRAVLPASSAPIPGFGRVVALRWFEMLIGVLLKQAAIALVLSVLLYAYSLIMGTSDAVLPWALKILMIALVTVAVFIYRKPFRTCSPRSATASSAPGTGRRRPGPGGRAAAPATRATRPPCGVPGLRGLPGRPLGPAQPRARRPALAASVATAGGVRRRGRRGGRCAPRGSGEAGSGADQAGTAGWRRPSPRTRLGAGPA